MSSVLYIAGPEADASTAQQAALALGLGKTYLLKRRGTTLGWIAEKKSPATVDATAAAQAWQAGGAYLLKGYVSNHLTAHEDHIQQSLALMHEVADGAEVADIFEQAPYIDRTEPQFEMLSSFQDEGDDQEIETIEYDAIDSAGEVIGENLWCKASWLSFEDDDASLRFRFSFGLAGYEDVAADFARQDFAAKLTDAIFPESAIISQNESLTTFLNDALLGSAQGKLAYVERIIYFNAPNGGAQFHQDVERGHLGVVFAQVHGSTGWLACSKSQLIDEVQGFLNDQAKLATLADILTAAQISELTDNAKDRAKLNAWLDERDNEPLEKLLNRSPMFYQQLIAQGLAYIVNPGDIILLPQAGIDDCCWHTVFCLDDFPGESLSFAVRKV